MTGHIINQFSDDISNIIDLILRYGDRLTVGGLLLLLVVALWQEWLVPGPRYKAKVSECDTLRSASDRLLAFYQERERLELKVKPKPVRKPRARLAREPLPQPKAAMDKLEGGLV